MKKDKNAWKLIIFIAVLIAVFLSIFEILLISKYVGQPSDTIPDSRYNEIMNYADTFTNVYQGKSEQHIPNLKKAGILLDTNIYESTDQEDLRFNITVQDKEYNADIRITYPVKFSASNNVVIGTDFRQVEIKSNNISVTTIVCSSILCAVVIILVLTILVMSAKDGKDE